MTNAADLAARVAAGEARAVARLISWVEDGAAGLPEALAALPVRERAYVVGLTGSPGVGKSTVTSTLVAAYRARGERVGVLAIDPSSPFSGGALLGDRIRMQEHATDEGVFIRSMASRGHLGGMAAATPQAVRVLEAAGCGVALVETVGVGQSEVDVAATADATVVLLAPGMGDGIQAAKAGILEIADIVCVNKADRDGAESTAREVRQMLRLAAPADGWVVPVVTSSAARGQIADLVSALDERRAWLDEEDRWAARRRQRAAAEILALAVGRSRVLLAEGLRPDDVDAVASGRLTAFAAADRLVGGATPHPD
ncbi:MAG: methylmalonyl Co-A mutase-associated GTPase MeaB [Candidatus Nanopelagicales bacterium]